MKFLWIILCVSLSACTNIPSSAERRNHAALLATAQGWHAVTLPASGYDLVAYFPKKHTEANVLVIYIEGDGFAWINGSQASTDPTPRDPLALRLALAQPEGNAAYLARPCQYVDAEVTRCSSRYWTEMRFAPEVIAASSVAIDALKLRFGANRLILVGYSGGGAVAALVAAKRVDVERVVTIAGNLDHHAWTTHHHIRALVGSLNPANEIEALRRIPQRHFVGGKDRNITPELVRAYTNRFPAEQRPVIYIEPEFDHHCCWAEQWPTLWRKIQASNE
jgi:dienelactone hydrolase